MNKYKKPVLIASIILLIGFIFYMRSCQDRTYFPLDDISAAIPGEAAVVIALDLPQILNQIEYSDIKVQSTFEKLASKATIENPILAEILKDPKAAGININNDAYFVLMRDTNGLEQHLSVLLFGITDKAKFESLVLKKKAAQNDISRENNYSHVLMDQMTITGWSDQLAIIASSSVFINLPENITTFFCPPSPDAVNHNKHFVTAMKRDDSFKYWISMEPFSHDAQLMSSMGMSGLSPQVADGNYIIGGIDFQKGKIVGEAEFMLDLDVQLGINRLFKSEKSKPFYYGYPDKNLAFTLFGSLNLPLILKSALGSGSSQNQLESYLKQQGLKLNDFYKSFGGDVLINTYYQNDTSSILDLFITMDITDVNRLERILTWADKNELMNKVNNHQYVFKNKWKKGITHVNLGGERALYLIHDNDRMIISNNYSMANDILSAKSNSIPQFYSKLFDNSQFAGFINMQWLSASSKDAIYENIEFQLDEDGINFQFKMLDNSSNALKQLITEK